MTKKALITGITGQDGSYLAEHLLALGYEVHGIIRRSSSFNTARIDAMYRDPHDQAAQLFLHFGDLSDGTGLRKIVTTVQPDEIYNLAAQSHVRVSFDQPEYTADIVATGTLRLLEVVRDYARDADTKVKLYNASSSEMFGSSPPPQGEDTRFHPRSPYAASKLAAYWYCVNARESYDLFICNGILFNHESPRRGETFVTRKITRALARIKLGLQEKLFLGNLDARRDWGFAGDYVVAMHLMLQQDAPDDYVVATGESYSVRDFLTKAAAHLGMDWEACVEMDARYLRPAEVDALCGDASKARRVLKWEPKVSFDSLVGMMVDHDMELAQRELTLRNAGHDVGLPPVPRTRPAARPVTVVPVTAPVAVAMPRRAEPTVAAAAPARRDRPARTSPVLGATMALDARIFVAGHTGLVGSALVRTLEAQGYRNVLAMASSELDLRRQAAVEAWFAAARPQYVFVAAARVGGILANSKYPAEFIRDNLLIQTNVLDAAYNNGCDKLTFLGSSCVYPKHAPQPMTEDALLTGPLEPTNEPYALAKISGIRMAQAYNKQYGFCALSLMPTNLYGEHDNFDLETSHVLPALIRKFHEAKCAGHKAVTLWGTGTPRREFLHVDDMASAAVHLMNTHSDPALVNVGVGQDIEIRELAAMVREVVGYQGAIEWDRTKPDGSPRKLLDVSRLTSLGWKASIALREGIVRTYAWYEQQQRKAAA